jgi:hypothetical protein
MGMKPNTPTKYNYLYKIVCNVTGKFYYGIHSTNSLKDGNLAEFCQSRKQYWPNLHYRRQASIYRHDLRIGNAHGIEISRLDLIQISRPFSLALVTASIHVGCASKYPRESNTE